MEFYRETFAEMFRHASTFVGIEFAVGGENKLVSDTVDSQTSYVLRVNTIS